MHEKEGREAEREKQTRQPARPSALPFAFFEGCVPHFYFTCTHMALQRQRESMTRERERERKRPGQPDERGLEIKMMDARPPSFIVCVLPASRVPALFLFCVTLGARRHEKKQAAVPHTLTLSLEGGHPPSPVRARPPRGRLLSRTHAGRPPLAPRGHRRPRLCRRRVRHVRLVHGDPPPPPGRRRPDSQAAEPAHNRVRTPPPVARAACPRRPLPREQAEAGGEAERPLEVVDEGPD